MVPARELMLAAEPDAAPRARRFVAEVLADAPEDTVSTAELVVTELVTNAVLHAKAPIVVRIFRTDGGARIEVEDGGRDLPIAPPLNPHSMTGRGLALVTATTAGWGVEPLAGGRKTIWAEVSAGPPGAGLPELDLTHLERPGLHPTDEPVFTVRLGSVPTDLLLAAKGHVDNVLREFHLVTSGAATVENQPPPELATLIETMAQDFAVARNEIKRQAVAAAGRGDLETELVLTLPVSAAAAGERYLAALDKVDAYARSAALLTLESAPAHRVFRQWYVQGLVDRLRALAAGGSLPVVPSFPQALAAEVERLSSMRDVSDRLSRLQQVTGELSQARTVSDTASALAGSAARHLDALSARVYLLQGDALAPVTPASLDEPWAGGDDPIPLTADRPAAEVARSRKPLAVRGRAALAGRYPDAAETFPDDVALHSAPLIVGAECIGVLTLTFPIVGMDEQSHTDIVTTLADTVAQALERAISTERAAEANAKLAAANERLAFIADASIVLSGTLDYEGTLDAIPKLMIPRFADWCSLQLMDEGALRLVAITHVDPERTKLGHEIMRRYPVRPNTDVGAGRVLRTGRPELLDPVTPEMIEAAAVESGHGALLRGLGAASALVVPLVHQEELTGVLTLVYSEPSRKYVAADVPFAQDIARRVGAALRSASAYRDKAGELADVRRVADAAQRAILAPPPALIGPVALAARYVGAAAEAQVGGDFYEVVPRPGSVRMLIGDVRGKGLSAVRVATIVLGEFRAVAADLANLPAIAGRLDQRLRPHLGEEDFVTALLAEIHDDGTFSVASCGHPPALMLTGDQINEVGTEFSLPLGLGADPVLESGQLRPGDRLLLYTDGAIETRDADRRFLDFIELLRPALDRDHVGVLDAVLTSLRQNAGGSRLNDDLALLIAEYRGQMS
ncbi:SpoIIE family protein phosphatase [Sporichthya sp.]|uniref:SpoIIE family protein phosphatase n=1 Tax=Sporichthya sp. TaxID=65475 RepID=UPI00182DFAEB|nr:SpoIIE family protein phosphatase [Sporichthya sp.]MBA3742620.1 SpoIIE family protein phosphatase [Sporichthya sp.]